MRVKVHINDISFNMPDFGVINSQVNLIKLIEMGIKPFYPILDIRDCQMIETPIIITSLPYPRPDLGENMLFCDCIKLYDWGEYKETCSLGDRNIEGGGYNDHHLFTTKQGAEWYIKHILAGRKKLPRNKSARFKPKDLTIEDIDGIFRDLVDDTDL